MRSGEGPSSRLRLALILVTIIQIALGTQVRGSVDAALDSGIPRTQSPASVGLIDHVHRDAALVVLAFSIFAAAWVRVRRRLEITLIRSAYVVVALAILQSRSPSPWLTFP